MNRGTQIAYIPMHAYKKIEHPDVEFGFVTTHKPEHGYTFCRYWRRGEPGVLRTLTNSECTPSDMIVEHILVDQSLVDSMIEKYC